MKKILVVEDEYYARKSIVKILQESDLDIQVCGEAANGMKAIELLEEYKDIALVITDIQAKLNHRRWSIWTIKVYHTQNGNANITLYLFRNTERKFCMEE